MFLKVKRSLINQKKILAIHATDKKKLVARQLKELLQFKKKSTKHPNREKGRRQAGIANKRKSMTTNKHKRRCSDSLMSWEMQIKTTVGGI